MFWDKLSWNYKEDCINSVDSFCRMAIWLYSSDQSMHMEDLSSATFSNLFLQCPEVCIIQVFHLHGSSYTKVFYII